MPTPRRKIRIFWKAPFRAAGARNAVRPSIIMSPCSAEAVNRGAGGTATGGGRDGRARGRGGEGGEGGDRRCPSMPPADGPSVALSGRPVRYPTEVRVFFMVPVR
ncbi:hypothetical protein GWI33_005556 [Rhynchophorus ferrugineus]|uniref:Uncharacterized protein n=1 Tax=Rhynchophorus ferrugineus TaxID=354439 RepID=A0A834IJ27_RHYFE|nr:hypothetical protein GWI33_005556 [Rhynchophorus ferrugineus]